MIERLKIVHPSLGDNEAREKINELIEVVNLIDWLLDKPKLPTQTFKFGECCKICGKELSLHQCDHESSLEVGSEKELLKDIYVSCSKAGGKVAQNEEHRCPSNCTIQKSLEEKLKQAEADIRYWIEESTCKHHGIFELKEKLARAEAELKLYPRSTVIEMRERLERAEEALKAVLDYYKSGSDREVMPVDIATNYFEKGELSK